VYHKVLREVVWRCADGKCVPISKLSDRHLDNIIAMLSRSREQNELLVAMMYEKSIKRLRRAA
jgi:hypothetical protein